MPATNVANATIATITIIVDSYNSSRLGQEHLRSSSNVPDINSLVFVKIFCIILNGK